MKFDPIMRKKELRSLKNAEHVQIAYELEHNSLNGCLPEMLSSEIAKVKAADWLVLVFPMVWSNAPCILRGWFDKVIIYGANGFFDNEHIFEKGWSKGKYAQVITCTNEEQGEYGSGGVLE